MVRHSAPPARLCVCLALSVAVAAGAAAAEDPSLDSTMSQPSVIDVTGDDGVSPEVAGEHADPELSSAPEAATLQTLDVLQPSGPTLALEPEPEPEPAPPNPRTHCVIQTSIEGLWLFTNVVDEAFQLQLVEFTESALAAGRAGQLPGRTFQVSVLWRIHTLPGCQ